MSTPDQQLRIDRLTREALGNPHNDPVDPRWVTALVLAVLITACGITAAIGERPPTAAPIAHRFVSVEPSALLATESLADLTY